VPTGAKGRTRGRVGKGRARADSIQYADLLAFYSRRDGVSFLKAQNNSSETYEMETMLKIILETCPHRRATKRSAVNVVCTKGSVLGYRLALLNAQFGRLKRYAAANQPRLGSRTCSK
jgi:hypothetical protein